MSEYGFHPIANLFPLMEGGEFAALVEDIRRHGLRELIVLYEGMVLDGRNRDRACRQAGIEPRYRVEVFSSHAEATTFVISANIHRRHLTIEQRRNLIGKLLKTHPEQSDRQIAETAKTDHKTVAAVRRQAEGRGEIPHVKKRTDRKGRKQPAAKREATSAPTLPVPEADTAPARSPSSKPTGSAEQSVEDRRLAMELLDLRAENTVFKNRIVEIEAENAQLRAQLAGGHEHDGASEPPLGEPAFRTAIKLLRRLVSAGIPSKSMAQAVDARRNSFQIRSTVRCGCSASTPIGRCDSTLRSAKGSGSRTEYR
jgi:hypothetical protein